MRILYLAHRVPYPPNKGDKIRSYHHVRHLARCHEVHLLSFVDEPGDDAGAQALRECCATVGLVRLDKKQALVRGAWALARGRSLSEGYFGCGAMRHAVARAAAERRFDLAWAFSSVMASYLTNVNVPRRVVDIVDVDSEKWRQFADRSRGPLRWAYRLEARRLRAFEASLGAWTDRVLFVSPGEVALFRSFCPQAADVRVIANGVDTEYFRATSGEIGPRQPQLLFTGALDYRPNVEAVLSFARDILPLIRRDIPEARFVAVGHRPAARLLQEVSAHGGALQIAGSVPDVRPYFRAARVYVAPLQLGRGVQNKILEAMAMRVPVVASPLAVAGLEVDAGRHALVCTRPEEFAAAVVSLLRDERRCRELTDAASHLIAERYSWEENLKLVDACLDDCARPPREEPGSRQAPTMQTAALH